MKKINVCDILKWKGYLYEAVGKADMGQNVVFLHEVNAKPCHECGEIKHEALIEGSAYLEDNLEPIQTVL